MDRIDLGQARRRAKDLLEAARRGEQDAIARLPRSHSPVVLADAQLAVARELGFPSWPKFVASIGWQPAGHHDVDWGCVSRATFVLFVEERGELVVPVEGLPCDAIRPGEDVLVDAALRIPLEQAGFRSQGRHVFALSEQGTHVAIWVDGDRYRGQRRHRQVEWHVTSPREIDDPLLRLADTARRALTHEQAQRDMRRVLEPAYMRASTPQGGSGFNGTLEEWTQGRRMITDAIAESGSFLDVGCANGFLMECVVRWCAEKGVRVEPFGLDASPMLAAHARQRLPHWSDRIWIGDALTWSSPRQFDFVHSLLDFVRPWQRRQLIGNLLAVVAPGGRLILSQYGTSTCPREMVERSGFVVNGETAAPAGGYPSAWIIKPLVGEDGGSGLRHAIAEESRATLG